MPSSRAFNGRLPRRSCLNATLVRFASLMPVKKLDDLAQMTTTTVSARTARSARTAAEYVYA